MKCSKRAAIISVPLAIQVGSGVPAHLSCRQQVIVGDQG